MDATAYLENEISTATPQRLRLMLIEGALKFARQTQEYCRDNKFDFALEPYQRCRTILLELSTSVRRDVSDLGPRVAGMYSFLYRRMSEGYFQRELRAFDEVIRVLEEEQTTWQEVCRRMPEAPRADLLPPAAAAEDISSAGMTAIAPPDFNTYAPGENSGHVSNRHGFSLEI